MQPIVGWSDLHIGYRDEEVLCDVVLHGVAHVSKLAHHVPGHHETLAVRTGLLLSQVSQDYSTLVRHYLSILLDHLSSSFLHALPERLLRQWEHPSRPAYRLAGHSHLQHTVSTALTAEPAPKYSAISPSREIKSRDENCEEEFLF